MLEESDKGGRGCELEVVIVPSWCEPRDMLAKDCMESSKGVAGFRMKSEMASRGFALAPARKTSHQTGSDWWWVIKLRAWDP